MRYMRHVIIALAILAATLVAPSRSVSAKEEGKECFFVYNVFAGNFLVFKGDEEDPDRVYATEKPPKHCEFAGFIYDDIIIDP